MNGIENVKIVLASKSPRREELLKYITDDFEILPADCEEVLPEGVEVFDVPEFLAVQKAMNVSKKRPDAMVIGCDTVVIVDGEILGKPHTEEKAFEMLKKLSGKAHNVVSGVCICYKGKTMSFSQNTLVGFYPLSDEEILSYIRECNPLDKAGSYGIQDRGGLFVKEIIGDYYNIVGFPIARLSKEMEKMIKLFG